MRRVRRAAGRIERIRQYLGEGCHQRPGQLKPGLDVLRGPRTAGRIRGRGRAAIYTHIAVVGYQQRTLRPYRVIYDWAAVTAACSPSRLPETG